MKSDIAANLLKTLGNNNRLLLFRLLIQAGSNGLHPTYLCEKLEIQPNKLSFHLNALKNEKLILATKQGRNIIYKANYNIMKDLVDYLFENCCNNETQDGCVTAQNNNC